MRKPAGVMTRPVRTCYKPEPQAFSLQAKTDKKAVAKKPVVWPEDPEKAKQGQSADCGEDMTSLESYDLMECECLDDALQKKQQDKKNH